MTTMDVFRKLVQVLKLPALKCPYYSLRCVINISFATLLPMVGFNWLRLVLRIYICSVYHIFIVQEPMSC